MKTPTPEINPYEVTALSAPSAPTPSPAAALVERKYQLHMHWADRRRFLKAVDPLRFVAIIGFLTGGMGLLGAIGSLGEIWRVGEPVLTTRRIISFAALLVNVMARIFR